jgi:hypothetical protein
LEYLAEQALQRAGARINQILELATQQASGPLQVTHIHLSELSIELQQANRKLQMYSGTTKNASLDEAIARYRRSLEQLRLALPQLQARLLMKRAHLERESNHLKSAARWAKNSKNIL